MTNTQQAAITSPDLQAERLNQLKRLMPDLFDGEGNLDEAALRGVVNPDAVPTTERFRFEWAGKQQSKRAAFTPSKATLIADPARSVDFDSTQNLIIEGDNLEVLKLLQTSYNERVKCIYIDPPYNTRNDFIYPDDFSEGKKAYWQRNGTVKEGVKLTALPESHGRKHSLWLNMMQSRLLLARQLLREDGVIFISIDDNEQANLKRLCDEVFGEDNFISQIIWHNSSRASEYVATEHEYILAYAKNITSLDNWKCEREEAEIIINGVEKIRKSSGNHEDALNFIKEKVEFYKQKDKENKTKLHSWLTNYTNIDDNWNIYYAVDLTGEGAGPARKFGDKLIPAPEGRHWMGQEYIDQLFEEDRIVWRNERAYRKLYIQESEENLKSILVIPTRRGSEYLKGLLGKDIFDKPKPHDLLKHIAKYVLNESDTILDFFAGSGTTADAVMQLNAQDGGNRRHILVQVPEYTDESSEAFKAGYKTISSLCIERVKRAGEKIRRENPDAAVDTGFRVYRLTDSHFPQNFFAPDPNKTEAENVAALEAHLATGLHSTPLLPELSFADVVTEIALKNGYGVFHTLERLATFTKNAVYQLQGNDKAALLCLDPALNDATVEALEAHSNEQLIVSSYALDTAKKWVLQQAYKDNLHVV
jgi:adenine-specific DNA-methyltransferase